MTQMSLSKPRGRGEQRFDVRAATSDGAPGNPQRARQVPAAAGLETSPEGRCDCPSPSFTRLLLHS